MIERPIRLCEIGLWTVNSYKTHFQRMTFNLFKHQVMEWKGLIDIKHMDGGGGASHGVM